MTLLRTPSALIASVFGLAAAVSGASVPNSYTAPTARVKNGTYKGVHSPEYNQDFFLGMPYAQPPVGDLRLNNPAPLNASFSGTRDATKYGPICAGYLFADDWPFEKSEDCLSINIVRPAGVALDAKLPVATWFYGGGFFSGNSADQRYNLSFIVQNSMEMGKPIIAVSLNYRVAQWGFLSSDVILKEGVANLGIKDQRLALHWLQENIGAFGGDPQKVTIWGESAGAGSVAYQSILYGGRDDHLFRGIVAESVYQAPLPSNTTVHNQFYDAITNATGCGQGPASLECLRKIPYAQLNQVFNATAEAGELLFGPVTDGDLLKIPFSESFACGGFTRKPLLIGINTDEGTAFAPKGINTTEQFGAMVAQLGADAAGVAAVEKLYPDVPALGVPVSGYPNRPPMTGPEAALGQQWKRSAALYGDYLFHGPRRNINQKFTQFGVKNYAYRFNVVPNGNQDYIGVTHFSEVAWVMDDEGNYGYTEPVSAPPFGNRPKSYRDVAKLMSRMWVSFVHDQDPNNHGIPGTAHWPTYADTKTPQNFVFDANVTSHLEDDTYRAAGIKYINDNAQTQFHR